MLRPLIDADRAGPLDVRSTGLVFGHRYRSGFWAIYLLSAVAVLCAVLPLALGWDTTPSRPASVRRRLGRVARSSIICAVASIYWLGHRRDWQGQWLRARTTAELIRLSADARALVISITAAPMPIGICGCSIRASTCAKRGRCHECVSRIEPLARERLTGAWNDPAFVSGYARWTVAALDGQRRYHHRVALRQQALQHRVHGLNTCFLA